VGAPDDGRSERSWEQLPRFICMCSVAKLATLIVVLPLLLCVAKPSSAGDSATQPVVGVMRPLSAAQTMRRLRVWYVQNRAAAGLATALITTALVSLVVALFASAPAARSIPRPFPPVERMAAGQLEAMAKIEARARELSKAATPELLRLLDGAPLRAHLRDCCNKSGIASWPAGMLLGTLRDAAATAELVHNFEGFEWVTDISIEMLEHVAVSYFPMLWQVRYHNTNTMRSEWGHPQSCEDAAEEGIFGLKPFGGEHDLPTSWEQASSRLHYVALNMLRVDRGNPQFGRVAAVFSPSFWDDAVAATPVDSGLYQGWCNASYMALPNATHSIGIPVECGLLDPSPGVRGSLDHVLLNNARARLLFELWADARDDC